MKKLTLAMKKTTDQTVVFGEVVAENSLEFAIVSNLYINKRDLGTLGISTQTPRLEVTIKAIPAA